MKIIDPIYHHVGYPCPIRKSEKPGVTHQPEFRIGKIAATAGVFNRVSYDDRLDGLRQQISGDWGEVSDEIRQANQMPVRNVSWIVSVHHAGNGIKYFIITRVNRRALTTLSLSEDV